VLGQNLQIIRRRHAGFGEQSGRLGDSEGQITQRLGEQLRIRLGERCKVAAQQGGVRSFV
jgi:hypothetical protein